MSLVLVTVTGDFPNAIGQAASVTFTPSADLDDPADAEFVAMVPDAVDLSATGAFSVPLISTGNAQIVPAGWQWQAVLTVGARSGTFSFYLPETPNPVDLTALMPPGWQL